MFPPPVATKTVYTIWKQIVKLIPPQIVSRTFTPWSHLLALIYQQLTRTESLNGVCDAAAAFECEWGRMRGAQVPRRNTFSNANRRRDPKMAELFEHYELTPMRSGMVVIHLLLSSLSNTKSQVNFHNA